MEYALTALLILVGIVALVLIVRFIKFLFSNYLVSRFLSIGSSVANLIVAFAIDGEGEGVVVAALVLSVLAWLFFIGPAVCEVHWDGTFHIDYERGRITPGQTLGLIGNAVVSTIVFFILYGAAESPVIFFLVPMAILLLNIVGIIRLRR